MTKQSTKKVTKKWYAIISCSLIMGAIILMVLVSPSFADEKSGLEIYKHLLSVAKGQASPELFETLNTHSRNLNWNAAIPLEFKGNLRLLKAETITGPKDRTELYFVRKLDGEIFLLSLPVTAGPKYENLHKMTDNKLNFKIMTTDTQIDGRTYTFCQFIEKPTQAILDRVFKLCIILMLFFVMVGMGLTLTFKDFALVFTKPIGVFIGEVLQFGFMPLVALGLGYLMGFHEHYPFVFVGMILITATPGGVTSNLMTHYAKGDVALSISLTSLSTALAIIFVPLLLNVYCANIPEIQIPVKTIVTTIVILVIVPLIIGMSVRQKWEKFAEKSVPFFSALGIIALVFLIIGGVLSNLDKFADTERYGFLFYTMVLTLTFLGMFFGALVPKLFGVSNYQTRAISLETGLRNASLAMAVALLIQDSMGDFYSSMFVVSGAFGLVMYVAGIISIKLYKHLLPVADEESETAGSDVNLETVK